MIYFSRLCGVLAALYLLYFGANKLTTDATAAGPQPMAMAVNGEMMPAMEAVEFNYLQTYQARYPVFPAVLDNSRWVHTLDDRQNCTSKPRKVWTFSGGGDFGRSCKAISSSGDMIFKCEETHLFGRKTDNVYLVEFGDPIMPDWALERPHITLQRQGTSKKTIGLQMCES